MECVGQCFLTGEGLDKNVAHGATLFTRASEMVKKKCAKGGATISNNIEFMEKMLLRTVSAIMLHHILQT